MYLEKCQIATKIKYILIFIWIEFFLRLDFIAGPDSDSNSDSKPDGNIAPCRKCSQCMDWHSESDPYSLYFCTVRLRRIQDSPLEGRKSSRRWQQMIFPKFPKYFMKLKKIWAIGGMCRMQPLLRSATAQECESESVSESESGDVIKPWRVTSLNDIWLI